ncbi:MAG: hypothetical protein M1828_002059 [Chrysothrix sp. TS-e1954]|nr:MAG: hypothetical protein M1828_002059 [Chrysothrix sp. TS-e1954]
MSLGYDNEKAQAQREPLPRVSSDFKDHTSGRQFSLTGEHDAIVNEDHTKLIRGLHGRHMQMIAIGGAIGAGLFIASGGALASGGPGSLLICFMIIGVMMLLVMQALGELAVMYPINGAFYTYIVRFIDPSWGFAMGWDYAIQWLTILPFEITAASLTIQYWRTDINIGVWIATFLAALIIVQYFGVRGYGETEFVLAMIKITACTGFIIFGIIVNCGGVPTDNRGYIGAHYWHDPGAFLNGFKGFCSVFVTASFAFAGTELTGLAAAEAEDPRRQLPKATKQVFWRIAFFYVVNLFIVGLIVPADNPHLLDASTSSTAYSPFVLAITLAGVKGLPSVFNVVICLSVLSVANSATFGSTRTLQALAMQGMAPKFLAYVDKKGRPLPTVVLQLLFGLLAFIGESSQESTVFGWLLALSGVANFFVWGSICLAHIRFRGAWKYNGHAVDELPFKAFFGIWGSIGGLSLNILCLIAQFYVALWPIGADPDPEYFFEQYLAAPLILFLYLVWKIYSFIFIPAHRPLFVRTRDMDIYTGMRDEQKELMQMSHEDRRAEVARWKKESAVGFHHWYDYPLAIPRALF